MATRWLISAALAMGVSATTSAADVPLGHKDFYPSAERPIGFRGAAGWFGVRNNGVFPSGNRIFLQSAMAMYAIGDPAVKFDWNPQSRPAQVTAQLRGTLP